MDLIHAGDFVGLRALGQGGEDAGDVHPGGVAENDSSVRVVAVDEGTEEGVEIVWGGGEVEPVGVEKAFDVSVERWHAFDGSRIGDKGTAEDADGRGGHGDFDGVVDI